MTFREFLIKTREPLLEATAYLKEQSVFFLRTLLVISKLFIVNNFLGNYIHPIWNLASVLFQNFNNITYIRIEVHIPVKNFNICLKFIKIDLNHRQACWYSFIKDAAMNSTLAAPNVTQFLNYFSEILSWENPSITLKRVSLW